jgi:integrase
MRRGEIIGLKWNDIDFERMTFEIKRAATPVKGEGTVTDKTKNVKSMRKLELPEVMKPILLSLRAKQSESKLRLDEKWIDENWIFTQWNGALMSIHTPDIWWSKMKREHDKIPDKTLHTLRHTFATYLINNNVPLSAVSGALGHAQQSTTLNIYSHVLEDSKKAAMQAHEAHIMGLKKQV